MDVQSSDSSDDEIYDLLNPHQENVDLERNQENNNNNNENNENNYEDNERMENTSDKSDDEESDGLP